MKSDYQLAVAKEVLKHTAREIGNDYQLNVKLRAVCLSYGHKVDRPGCVKCISDAMDFLSKETGIKRGWAKKQKNGKILSAI